MTNDRKTEIWNEIAHNEAEKSKSRAKSFVQQTNDNREGISARREKFIKDLNTGSPKVMPADKRDNF